MELAQKLETGGRTRTRQVSVLRIQHKSTRTFIPYVVIVVPFLDNPVDVGNGSSDKERESKGRDIKAGSPKTNKESVEDTKDGESPTDAVKGDLSTHVGELVKDEAEEEKVDKGPDPECPVRWGDVGLLGPVRVLGLTMSRTRQAEGRGFHVRERQRQSRRCYPGRGNRPQY
jgi:hypothetical protein